MSKFITALIALAAGLTIGMAGVSNASETHASAHCSAPAIADGHYWSVQRITQLDGRDAAYVAWVQAFCGSSRRGSGGWYWKHKFARYVDRGDWSAPFPKGMPFWENPGLIDR